MRAFRVFVLATTLLGASLPLLAQKPAARPAAPALTPPAAVKAAFAKRFPTATAAKWEKEQADYEANFMLDGAKTSAVYTAAGALKEIEKDMPVSKLPVRAAEYVAIKYPGKKVTEVARIEDAAGKVRWEAEVGGKDLIFSPEGRFQRVEAEDDDAKGGKGDDKD